MSRTPITPQIQEDLQEHYTIHSRELTPITHTDYSRHILVTNDNQSNRIYFNMFHTFDNRELQNKEISILWINANNEKGMSRAVDKNITGDRLYFAWDVPQQATYKEGTIHFAIRITSEDYVWNSLGGSVEVYKGLVDEEYNSLSDAELEPGWVDYIEGKYSIGMQKLTVDDFNALTNKEDNMLYLVVATDGSITQFLGNVKLSADGVTSSGTVNSLTVTYSNTIAGESEYVTFDRTAANYSVYHLNTDTNELTCIQDNISAMDLVNKSFGYGVYYVVCSEPIMFKDSHAVAIDWKASYTITSGSLYVNSAYVYTSDSVVPNNISVNDIKLAGTSRVPYANGFVGNYNNLTINADGYYVHTDDYQCGRTGYVFSAARIECSDINGSWSINKFESAEIGTDIKYCKLMPQLTYNSEPVSPLIETGYGLEYVNGKLQSSLVDPVCAKWSHKQRTNNVVDIIYPDYETANYDIYLAQNDSLTVVHKGMSAADMTSVKFDQIGDYYIFCSTPITHNPAYVISSNFLANFTFDVDGIIVTACQYFGTSVNSTPSSINSIKSSYNSQHYTSSGSGIYNSLNNIEGFYTASRGYVFTGAKISRTGSCTYFQVDRTVIPVKDIITYRSAIDLYVNNNPVQTCKDVNTSYAGYYPTNNYTRDIISYSGHTITVTGPINYTTTIPNDNHTGYRTEELLGIHTFDTTVLNSGNYYLGYTNINNAINGVPSGIVNFTNIVIDTYANIKSCAVSDDLVYGFATDTNRTYLIKSGNCVACSVLLLAKYTYDEDSQLITSFEKLFNNLSTATNDFVKLYTDTVISNIDKYVSSTNTPYGKVVIEDRTLKVVGGVGYTPSEDATGTSVILNQAYSTSEGNSCSGSYSLVTGELNDNKTNHNLVSGKFNQIKTVVDNVGFNACFGYGNQLTGSYNNVSGSDNNLVKSSYNIIGGSNNETENANYNAIFGSENTLKASEGVEAYVHNIISGNNNVLKGSNNIISGTNHTASATQSYIFGNNNTINSQAINSLIGGSSNTLDNVTNSVITGSNNTINTCTNSTINAVNCEATSVTQSSIYGTDIVVSNTNNSHITGSQINITSDFTNAMCVGVGISCNATNNIPRYLFGTYNANTDNNDILFAIGNGSDDDNRSNALTLESNGTLSTAGKVNVVGDVVVTNTEGVTVELLAEIKLLQAAVNALSQTVQSQQLTIQQLEVRITNLENTEETG